MTRHSWFLAHGARDAVASVRLLAAIAVLLVLNASALLAARGAQPGFERGWFEHPPDDARPAAFWMWNDELEVRELRRQLVSIQEAGIAQVVVHPRFGLGGGFADVDDTYYLSRDYFDKFAAVLVTARDLGLKLWLYDELNWPPGQAGGRTIGGGEVDGRSVPADPDFVARQLHVRARDVTGPARHRRVLGRPDATLVTVIAARPLANADCAEDGEPRSVPLDPASLRIVAHGERELEWDVPPGRWCLLQLVTTPLDGYRPERDPERPYVDLLNPKVTEKFIASTHDAYYRRFAEHFGKTIVGVYNDEPGLYANFFDGRAGMESRGSLPWTPGFEHFLDARGYDLRHLAAVWFDIGPDTTRARVTFYEALQDRYVEAYLKPLHDWAERHRVAMVANPLIEEDLGDHKLVQGGSLLRMLGWYQYPGIDTIGEIDTHQVTPNIASSVKRVYGRERAVAEAFGAFGWDLTVEEMRRTVTWLATEGIDTVVNHSLAYSLRGARADDAPPSQLYPSLLWSSLPAYAQFTGRLLAPLVGADDVRHVAVLYPTSTLLAEETPYSNQGLRDNGPVLRDVNASWRDSLLDLRRAQYGVDYVDEQVLAGTLDDVPAARVDDALLRVGDAHWSILVWPRLTTLSLEALDTVAAFVRAGGTLIALESLPSKEAHGRDSELRRRLTKLFAAPGVDDRRGAGSPRVEGRAVFLRSRGALVDAVRSFLAPDVVLTPFDERIRSRHVRSGDDDAYLVANLSGARLGVTATFHDPRLPDLWWPDTGEVTRAPLVAAGAGAVQMQFELEPFQALWVVFRGRAGLASTAPRTLASTAPVVSLSSARGTPVARIVTGHAGEHRVKALWQATTYEGTRRVTALPPPLTLDGLWAFRLDRPGARPELRALGSWAGVDPAWSGRGVYEREFHVPSEFFGPSRRAILDLGDVREVASVRVNGQSMQELLWRPFSVDVTDVLHPGRNTVTVVVTNTDENERGGRALDSGLLGPVVLRPRVVLDVPLAVTGR